MSGTRESAPHLPVLLPRLAPKPIQSETEQLPSKTPEPAVSPPLNIEPRSVPVPKARPKAKVAKPGAPKQQTAAPQGPAPILPAGQIPHQANCSFYGSPYTSETPHHPGGYYNPPLYGNEQSHSQTSFPYPPNQPHFQNYRPPPPHLPPPQQPPPNHYGPPPNYQQAAPYYYPAPPKNHPLSPKSSALQSSQESNNYPVQTTNSGTSQTSGDRPTTNHPDPPSQGPHIPATPDLAHLESQNVDPLINSRSSHPPNSHTEQSQNPAQGTYHSALGTPSFNDSAQSLQPQDLITSGQQSSTAPRTGDDKGPQAPRRGRGPDKVPRAPRSSKNKTPKPAVPKVTKARKPRVKKASLPSSQPPQPDGYRPSLLPHPSVFRPHEDNGLDDLPVIELDYGQNVFGVTKERLTDFASASAAGRQESRECLVRSDSEEYDSQDSEDEEEDDEGGEVGGGSQRLEESSGDEESEEENAEYHSMMSQVAMYKGGYGRGDLTGARDEDSQEPPAAGIEGAPPKRVRRRGPRKPAEPTGDIKLRLLRANEAFQESRIEEARAVVDEIIRINAETYEAWNLLSSIFQEQDLREDALMALIVAAHLRPKLVGAWSNAGEYALTSMGEITPKILRDAEFCFSSAMRQVPDSLEARRRKAQVSVMRGNFNAAARDYTHILRTTPYDLDTIRELALTYIDLNDPVAGLELYNKNIAHFKEAPQDYGETFDWNDLHTCAVLYSLWDKEEIALKEMKSLARWLLGREEETYWDDVVEDDCEWDINDIRRSKIGGFDYGKFPLATYGEGLPIELRIYLGKYRLSLGQRDEAVHHFNFLLASDDESSQQMVELNHHLILEVADGLYSTMNYKDALTFYESLKLVPEVMTAAIHVKIGKCFLHDDRSDEAELAFRTACVIDDENIEARVQMARMYERMDEAEQAFVFVNQVLELESKNKPTLYRSRNRNIAPKPPHKSIMPEEMRPRLRRQIEDEKQNRGFVLAQSLREQYQILRYEAAKMREDSSRAMDAWMDAARMLTEDFRSCKAFYPWDRKEFDGYSAEERIQAQRSLGLDLAALAQDSTKNIGSETPENASETPNHYRGIIFKEWVDIFCEYAVCLAKRGRSREAYDICDAAIHAICFRFNKEDMFTLHLCYCSCALMVNDEETCVAMARWFMVQYQFSTDAYRLFAAVMRMCHSPISWYSSGPTQKFILRQIKCMDWVLSNDKRRKVINQDRASYTQTDASGKMVINDNLDVMLLMIYGHILVAGSSFIYALNYFHRAYALDPENPMIVLSLGLSYMQYGLKRQVDNRQYAIMQGLTFMQRYYEIRKEAEYIEERQEAHYNMGRCYHLLGLTNLAIPYYLKVLKGEDSREKSDDLGVENMCVDVAYNLQTIYSMAGNLELAEQITREWLVI